MSNNSEPVTTMKQEVGRAAANLVKSDSIVGLGTGSTTAYAIEYIGDRLAKGEIKNIVGIPTSFQAEVLAKKYKIPLTTLEEPWISLSLLSNNTRRMLLWSILKNFA